MIQVRRVFLSFVVIAFLTGCASIRLLPSYYSAGSYLTVRKGDTLYAISRKTNIPMRDLIEENHLRAPYNLYVGQRLRVPAAKVHVVQKGETLYSISRKYDMTVSDLSRMNGLGEPYTISVGQKLKVNRSASGESVAAAPKNNASKQAAVTPKKTSASVVSTSKTASVPKSQSGKRFAWPVKGKVISSFGSTQKNMKNDGINIAAAKGTAVVAAEAGTVGYAGSQLKGYGNLILIRHSDGWMTAYAHNDTISVKQDQKVKKGQKIATVGTTGHVTTPQLHFEIRYKTKVVNPKTYLQ